MSAFPAMFGSDSVFRRSITVSPTPAICVFPARDALARLDCCSIGLHAPKMDADSMAMTPAARTRIALPPNAACRVPAATRYRHYLRSKAGPILAPKAQIDARAVFLPVESIWPRLVVGGLPDRQEAPVSRILTLAVYFCRTLTDYPG